LVLIKIAFQFIDPLEKSIAVVNYGMGNVGSIMNMLKKVGAKNVFFTNDHTELQKADKIILPGVGSFDHGVKNLRKNGLDRLLAELAQNKSKTILGICLGMQLMTKGSEEGKEPGLGWFDATTVKFQRAEGIRIPHMGWEYISIEQENPLLSLVNRHRFYFVHSYYVKSNSHSEVLCTSDYGLKFSSGMIKENLVGVQFHPEKSHRFGMKFMENFVNWEYGT
jgi:glutamine amidotransferase